MAGKKKSRAKKSASKKSAAKKSAAKKSAPKKSTSRKPRNRTSSTGADGVAGRWLLGLAMSAVIVVGVVVMAQPNEARTEDATEVQDVVPDIPEPLGTTVPEALRVQVVQRHPHDPRAFTQGLLWHGGKLYESTGLEGRSSVRRVDLATGAVEARTDVDETFFAEGLARVGDTLVQLTWQNERALVYDLTTLQKTAEHRYEGEGWGLCYDGTHLVMSDGSDRLRFRDPATFEVVREVRVTRIGRPLRSLNELECVDGKVWANVWQRNELVRIDPGTGRVEAIVDAGGLLTAAERRSADVLNGIAWLPETRRFLLTGKLWPASFEVEFVPR